MRAKTVIGKLSWKLTISQMANYVYSVIAKELKETGKCGFTASKPLPYYQSFSAGLPKNGPYNKAINFK
jgi:hypothetical protein